MFVATNAQVKIVDFIKKCNSKPKLLALILKNLDEFNPEYIEMENILKSSKLQEKIDFKVYSYSFSQPKEIEHVAKYIEFENPDIVIILADTPIEGFNRKIFEKFQSEGKFLLIKISRAKNKLNGNGYEAIYDAVFSSLDEAIDFFEKTCFLLGSKREKEKNLENQQTNRVFIGNVNDFLNNLSPHLPHQHLTSLTDTLSNNVQQAPQQVISNSASTISNPPMQPNQQQEVNILLIIETLKELKDSVEELKDLIKKQSQLTQKTKEKKTNNYSIVNILIIALLLLLIGILVFYK